MEEREIKTRLIMQCPDSYSTTQEGEGDGDFDSSEGLVTGELVVEAVWSPNNF